MDLTCRVIPMSHQVHPGKRRPGPAPSCSPESASDDGPWQERRAFHSPPAPLVSTSSRRQLAHILPPAIRVEAAFAFVGQAEVAKRQDGRTTFRCEGDLDRRGPRRNGRMALPAPAHHQPPRWIDDLVLAAYGVHAVDVDTVAAARPRVELGA